MNIVCPECETQYEVDDDIIGTKGRSLRCAVCSGVWNAVPDPAAATPSTSSEDVTWDLDTEGGEDVRPPNGDPDDFSAITDGPDAGSSANSDSADFDAQLAEISTDADQELATAHIHSRETEANKTENLISAHDRSAAGSGITEPAGTPLAALADFFHYFNLSRQDATFLITGVAIFMIVLGGRGWFIDRFPELREFYAAVGFNTEEPGLAFEQIETRIESDSAALRLTVRGVIRNSGSKTLDVRPVRFTIQDKRAKSLYSWGVASDSARLKPGEQVVISSQINDPPKGAMRVRIEFQRSKHNGAIVRQL